MVATIRAYDDLYNPLECGIVINEKDGRLHIGCVQGNSWMQGFPLFIQQAELAQLSNMGYGKTAFLPIEDPQFRFTGAGQFIQVAVQKGGPMKDCFVRADELQNAVNQFVPGA